MSLLPKKTAVDAAGQKTAQIALEMGVGRSLWSDARRRLWRSWSTRLCLAVVVLYALLALGGTVYEILADHGVVPGWTDLANFQRSHKSPAEAQNWLEAFGTDWAGRSVLVKTVLGAKVSLTVALMANIIAVPLGMFLGALAGYYGRRIDDFIVWLYSTLASIPGLVLLIAMKYAFKDRSLMGLELGGIHGIYIALGVISWVGTCRLVRAETMKIRELDYVMAARATGLPSLGILMRHVIPNVMHIGIINFSLGLVGAVSAEVMLSYLGLGVDVGVPSWGTMINSARGDLFAGRWWELTAAVSAMFLLVLALNIFGDRLRDALDPRLKV
jgi:peptide/nickel transport system permease protein